MHKKVIHLSLYATEVGAAVMFQSNIQQFHLGFYWYVEIFICEIQFYLFFNVLYDAWPLLHLMESEDGVEDVVRSCSKYWFTLRLKTSYIWKFRCF